jgi:hypothetical protein
VHLAARISRRARRRWHVTACADFLAVRQAAATGMPLPPISPLFGRLLHASPAVTRPLPVHHRYILWRSCHAGGSSILADHVAAGRPLPVPTLPAQILLLGLHLCRPPSPSSMAPPMQFIYRESNSASNFSTQIVAKYKKKNRTICSRRRKSGLRLRHRPAGIKVEVDAK